jgi:hypothetical protein
MARQIAAIDETILGYAPDRVATVIADLGRYPEWWVAPYHVETLQDAKGVGTRIQMSNGRFVRWVATLTHIEPDRIIIKYEGAWNGEARWSVASCQDGTRLIFRIDVDPGPVWLKLLARTRDLKRQHSQQMTHVFAQLRRQLEAVEGAAMEPSRPTSVRSRV